MQRAGLANLDWLVVRDLAMIESATFWKDGPEIETGEMRTEDIGTEVFFFPAANHAEKQGSFTNTQRLLQWHRKALDPPGDARSDLWFYFHLGRILKEKLADSTDERDRPLLDLVWDYPMEPGTDEPTRSRSWPRSTARVPTVSRCRCTPSCARTDRPGAGAGSTAGCTATASIRPIDAGAGTSRARWRRTGLGMAGEPARALQPGLGGSRR